MEIHSKVCRTCGINEGIIYVFDINQEPHLCDKITYCCPKVCISEGDGLPAYICCSCEKELCTAYEFILKCKATDRKLREVTCVISTRTHEELKPKIEVKLEDCPSDHDNLYEDIPDTYPLDRKENLGTKLENNGNILRAKQVQKRTKYNKTDANKCSVCGHKSNSPSALVVHMRNHNDERPFQCPNCNKNYKDKAKLKRHLDSQHSQQRARNFVCENCGKAFFSKNDVKIHMRTHTGETPYVCSECPSKFTQIGALIRHKRRHTGEKPHICTTCGKKFCTKEELKYHSRVHSDEKKYSCTICSLPFKYKNNLRKHMILHSAPNSFVCNHCGRTFNQKGNLKMHINRTHSEKSGYCNICFKNVSDVEVHMWRHTGHRPLKCEYCTSSFFEMKTLARHVNYRHKNPEKFKCLFEGCGMKFPAKAMLEYHTAKLHETVIPFPCDRCTRGFYRKNDLARHKIGTHKERLIQ